MRDTAVKKRLKISQISCINKEEANVNYNPAVKYHYKLIKI